MASKTERTVINAAALVQGIVLVTFPAASTIFTDKNEYGLSSTQYGDMFLPQVALAITASLAGAGLARRITTKRVYLLGLACSTISMVLLLASTLVKSNQAAAYPMLLVATAFLGAGFGLTVPVLNTYTSVFNPDSVERSVLTLNALLGSARRWRRYWWPSSSAWASGGAYRSPRRCCSRACCWSACGCRCGPEPGRALARRADADFRPGSGCMRRSPCATASARR